MLGTSTNHANYDCIIAGAGAAGCVLAGRLSEAPGKRILLLEAGPDAPPGREPADILDPYHVSASNQRYAWPELTAESGAEPGDGRPRASAPYPQALGVGGGSNINGMLAERGLPSDYDEWRDLGASGWGWEEVLPYFNKLERDLDFSGPLHGKDGPIPIRRFKPDQWAPFAQAVARFFQRRGAALLEDANSDFRDGVSSAPMNCLEDRRVSASMGYLTAEVRSRANLTILAETKVERLIIRDGCVCGVQVQTSGGAATYSASEVIVAGGAIHSPTLLLRSGIGPAQSLRSLGIEVVRDLPGVGRNLQNHPTVVFGLHLRSEAVQPANQRPWQQNLLRYSSKLEGCAEHDMALVPFGKVGWHALGRQLAMVAVWVNKAYSKGHVELASSDPAAAPRIRFNLLDDSRDFERLAQGVKLMLEVLCDDELLRVRNEIILPDMRIAARLARRSAWNSVLAWFMAKGLGFGPLRRAVLGGRTLDARSMLNDERAIRRYVREDARAIWHICGTCRMGRREDPETVVDSSCRVLGVEGLRVIDASVFPTVPAAATHLPVLMVAEKMADVIKTQWLQQRADTTPAS